MYTEKECTNVTQTDIEVHLEVLEIGCSFNLEDKNSNIFLLFQILQLQVLLTCPWLATEIIPGERFCGVTVPNMELSGTLCTDYVEQVHSQEKQEQTLDKHKQKMIYIIMKKFLVFF